MTELLSISIDLAGSTEIKGVIVSLTVDQPDHRRFLYDQYLKVLFWTEQTFYEMIGPDDRVNLDKLFLVKTIGDEFWFVYEVEDDFELKRAAAGLMDAIQAVFSKSRQLSFPSRPVEDFDKDTSDVKWENFDPPLKAVIDLLTDPVELNLARYDYLKDKVRGLSQAGQPDLNAANQRLIQLYNNLNIGSATLNSITKKATTAVRTDYVGLGVDLFFRISKYCRPCLLTVGDALMRRLDCTTEDVPEFEHLSIKALHQPVPMGAGTHYTRRNVIVEELRADQLKCPTRNIRRHSGSAPSDG
jgi:hypothetical protein